MNNNNDLNMLRKKYSSGPVYAVSFVQFESVTACLSGRIPLKKVTELKYSETKNNPVTAQTS